MKVLLIILFSSLTLLSACSSKQIYTGVQKNRQLHCERLQGAAREECLEQYDTSYEDYKTKKDSLKH